MTNLEFIKDYGQDTGETTQKNSTSAPIDENQLIQHFGKQFEKYIIIEDMILSIKPETIESTAKFIIENFKDPEFAYIHEFIIYCSAHNSLLKEPLIELWKRIQHPNYKLKSTPFTLELVSRGIEKETIFSIFQQNADMGDYTPGYEYSNMFNNKNALKTKDQASKMKIFNTMMEIISNDDLPLFTQNLKEYRAAFIDKMEQFFPRINLNPKEQKNEDYRIIPHVIVHNAMNIFKYTLDLPIVQFNNMQGDRQNYERDMVIYHRNDMLKCYNKKFSFNNISLATCIKSFNTLAFLYFYQNIDHSPSEEIQALYHAAKTGNFAIAQYIYENCHQEDILSFHFPNKSFDTTLTAAARKGHHEILKLVVRDDTNIMDPGYCNSTPLFLAAENGQILSLQFLYEKGARFSEESIFDAIKMASFNNHIEVVRFLYDTLSEAEKRSRKLVNCLIRAASVRNIDIVQFFIEKKIPLGKLQGCGRQELIMHLWRKIFRLFSINSDLQYSDHSCSKKFKSFQEYLSDEKSQEVLVLLLRNGCSRFNKTQFDD